MKLHGLGKKRVKQNYAIKIKGITGFEKMDGTQVKVSWKRGDKAGNKGDFPPCFVKDVCYH